MQGSNFLFRNFAKYNLFSLSIDNLTELSNYNSFACLEWTLEGINLFQY